MSAYGDIQETCQSWAAIQAVLMKGSASGEQVADIQARNLAWNVQSKVRHRERAQESEIQLPAISSKSRS